MSKITESELVNLNERFVSCLDNLVSHDLSITALCRSIGFTTTAQLNKIKNNESIAPSRALVLLINQHKINSAYLYGQSNEMFLGEENPEEIRKELFKTRQQKDDLFKKLLQMKNINDRLVKLNITLQEKVNRIENLDFESGSKPSEEEFLKMFNITDSDE